MAQYTDFIPQNVAPLGAKSISVYRDGKEVYEFPLGNLALKNTGNFLFRFLAISDIHLPYETAQDDFTRALLYANSDEQIKFTIISGDLSKEGTAEELTAYKTAVQTHSPNKPVRAIAGNHDSRQNIPANGRISDYTGDPLYYSFEYGGVLFLMVGIKAEAEGILFVNGELQWLYEQLEANRNRRCVVVTHVRPQDGCGNALGIYTNDIWGGTEATVFESLMRHYPNVVLMHGHSHLKLYMQEYEDDANLDKNFGCWSVHIPSLAAPRDTDGAVNPKYVNVYADSEGYVVDVYENGIHLRGRDFVNGEFLPIASYWLDTALQTVQAGTYKDSTGTIIS
jgi:predicted phosphodiesterase